MNKPEVGQRSAVNGAIDHQPAVDLQPDTVPPPETVHQLASDQQLDISTQAEIESLISHLSSPIRTVKRIPRLSRVTVARRLANVIKQVVSRNDVSSWVGLLSFSKKCLQTPARGGKRWSLATLINKQVTQEPSTETPATRPPQRVRPPKKHNQMEQLASRVSSKLEEGDYRGAVRLACSEDAIAEPSSETLQALKAKHPLPPPDSDIPSLEHTSPLAFTVDTQVIMKVISSFPKGSSGGFDGLLPQHLKDLTSPSAGDGGASLLTALVGLTTLILEGRTPTSICPLFFGANLTALTKKSGGIRPIAVGCTLRRLASKCASLHALESIPQMLAPRQLGFGVVGGIEAAVHASRIYLNHLPPHQAMVKVDFKNAFNSLRRDKMLRAVKDHIPDLLPFVHSAYSSPSILLWNDVQVSSAEGIQQGDPLGPMLFCLGIHNLVSSLSSEFTVFYLDDGTIGGSFEDIESDLLKIENQGKALGLFLNVDKSEVLSHSESSVSPVLSAFPGLQYVHASHAILLGSPLGKEALQACIEEQCRQLKVMGERLCHLQMHDAITILRHSLSIPKLLHILRTSPAFLSPLLESWDHLLESIVSRITNIDFDQGDSWLQATLPVKSGGLGFRSASTLAPSAFLASAGGASDLMQELLPDHLSSTPYIDRDLALSKWKQALPEDTPVPSAVNRQKSWDGPVVQHTFDTLLEHCTNEISTSRLLGAGSFESGAWLNAPPISSLGLRMPNEAIRIAIGLRVGASICLPHSCSFCGGPVDKLGLHGLSCRMSQGRIPRHQMLNNTIYHSLASANIPSRLEPSGLHRADGKRPDGVTLIPWTEGKFLVWDATCVDSFCDSRIRGSSREAGGAAAAAEKNKQSKYAHLDRSYVFQPIAVETCGTIGPDSLSFLRNLGRRLKATTGEPQSFAYLLQRLSVAIQMGNSASVQSTLELPGLQSID